MIEDDFIPQYFIKVSEKKEYSEGIAQGKIYMKESGYYRQLDDDFRGDVFDGKYPVDIEGSRIKVNGRELMEIRPLISYMTMGFEHDDKIPTFCSTIIDQDILYKKDNDTYCMKKEVINELIKFGDYAVIFDMREFINKMVQYADCNDFYIRYGKVKYVDSNRKYLLGFKNRKNADQLDVFFEKDQAYSLQNEWRVIIIDKDYSLIGNDKDYLLIDIGCLESAVVINTMDLHTFELIKNIDKD